MEIAKAVEELPCTASLHPACCQAAGVTPPAGGGDGVIDDWGGWEVAALAMLVALACGLCAFHYRKKRAEQSSSYESLRGQLQNTSAPAYQPPR